MAFMTNCTHKGCGKQMEPYLDPKTDKVFCSLCDNELTNITHFAKMQMKSIKQFKPKSTTSFAVKCHQCQAEVRPKLTKTEDVVCGRCLKPLDKLSIPFKNMLKEKLKTVDKDI